MGTAEEKTSVFLDRWGKKLARISVFPPIGISLAQALLDPEASLLSCGLTAAACLILMVTLAGSCVATSRMIERIGL